MWKWWHITIYLCLLGTSLAAITETISTTQTSENTKSQKEYSYETPKLDGADFPDCQLTDPDLNNCLKKVIEVVLPRFEHGDKQLNIPPLDPFVLNRTVFQYTNGAISGRILMRNGQVMGFRNTQIKKLDMKIQGDKVKFRQFVYLPTLRIMGNYKADVNISNIRLKPKGTYNVTLDEVNIEEVGDGVLYERDNHRYLRLINLDADPTIGNLHVQATGIFPDPSLDAIFMNVTNQYWRDIYRIMLPETKRYWAPELLRVINVALSGVPFDLFIKEK